MARKNTSSPGVSARERALMQDLCHHIAAGGDAPLRLRDLAQKSGLSPFHLQRRFKAVIGVSPREYQEACRLQALKAELKKNGSVTAAIYGAGFNSASDVYSRAGTRLGMTPRQYGRAGEGMAISYAAAQTPLGRLMIGATDRGICFIQFAAAEAELLDMLRAEFPAAALAPMDARAQPLFDGWIARLCEYLKGGAELPDLPLDIRGTAFQMKVWKFLQRIPRGKTQTYAEVAKGIGSPRAARAVASACAANRIAIAIPCHRVIRGDGGPGGYKWGLARKRELLDIEQA